MNDPDQRRLAVHQLAVHRAKVVGHQALRWVADRRSPIVPARFGHELLDAPRIAEDRSPLWNRGLEPEKLAREWPLELGKVENLRVAARALDGLELVAGQRFSFWAQVGPPVRWRGFVPGRELREGCVIPGIGGGLCLLSNGIYAAARRAELTVVERHPHSRRPPGSRAALGDDATVAWNYVDLRLVGARPWRLEVELDADSLIVGVRSPERRRRGMIVVPSEAERRRGGGGWAGDSGPSCLSCDQACVHAERPPGPGVRPQERKVWLLDAVWPEYAEHLREHVGASDQLCLALDGARLGVRRYAWPRSAAARRQFLLAAGWRSWQARSSAEQGAARQRALLDGDRRVAAAMAASLTPHDTELVISQSLLPHLHRLGVLGGRRLTVLMERLPLAVLQARLDAAALRWPDSPTLADFRADPRLLADEARALRRADRLLSPHAEIAELFPGRVERLAWAKPSGVEWIAAHRSASGPLRLWFPASVVGRKGAWELREALDGLGPVTLWVAGRELEGAWAWPSAVRVVRGSPSLAAVHDRVEGVVLPAWVEAQPRALLRAVAAGIPVVASTACGLHGVEGVTTIACGDVDSLRAAIVKLGRAGRDGHKTGSSAGAWV